MEAGELIALEALRRTQRVDLRPPQGLVDVDVPHARERSLVEQRRLDRGASTCEQPAEACCGEERVERLLAEARREVRVELAGLEEQPRSEAAHIAVGDVGAVVEPDERPPVGIVLEPVHAVAEASGHPQMDQENAVGLEPEDQILAAPLDGRHALALQLRGDRVGVIRPHEPRIGDLDAVEPTSGENGLQAAANGLDLGQLGHRSRLDSAARATAARRCQTPEGRKVSDT